MIHQLLKISEFAHLSGFNRKTLIYYDDIGLLSPEQLPDNGYRLYSYRQLETASVIGILREVGMPLRDIKQYLDQRTPGALMELFSAQRKNVEDRIRWLGRIETMLDTRLELTRDALEIDPSVIELRRCGEELLFAGEEITCQDTPEELEKALKSFYALCDREKVTYGYPFGTVVAQKNLLRESWRLPAYFFFKTPSGEGSYPRLPKPAGLYLTGFERCPYEGPQELYPRLFAYMKERGLAVSGDSYEEYLLDEIAVRDPDGYLLQVSIQVEPLG